MQHKRKQDPSTFGDDGYKQEQHVKTRNEDLMSKNKYKKEPPQDERMHSETNKKNQKNKPHFNPSHQIYVRAMKGVYQKLRRKIGWFFMLLFLITPWITYENHQAILIDIGKQQFHFFSTTLWPQDLTLLACLFILAAFALFFTTTFLGRVWCGYLCPQTVWTFIYIWFEEKLEGAANKRRKNDSLPLTRTLFIRKSIKHFFWLMIAFFSGISFVGYFVPINELFIDFFTFSCSFWVTFWVLFFTLCTYLNAGWMRSIMCLHICPYARFQSVMFDKDTFIVAYNEKRGEKRAPRQRNKSRNAGFGDCIDCNLCVQVCPTGIDIREGLQYECINCGACIDACNQTMEKMNTPKNLISYTTEHQLAKEKINIFRFKLVAYGSIALAMLGLFLYLLANVQPMRLDVIKDKNHLFQINHETLIENTYTLKILNKTQDEEKYSLSVSGIEGLKWYGQKDVTLKAGEIFTLPISLAVSGAKLKKTITKITFKLKRGSGKNKTSIETQSRFIGPIK